MHYRLKLYQPLQKKPHPLPPPKFGTSPNCLDVRVFEVCTENAYDQIVNGDQSVFLNGDRPYHHIWIRLSSKELIEVDVFRMLLDESLKSR